MMFYASFEVTFKKVSPLFFLCATTLSRIKQCLERLKMNKKFLIFTLLWVSFHTSAALVPSSLQCKDQAIAQAHKLLAFHFETEDDRIDISDQVKALPSIVNPKSKNQRFDVLEVWGYIYKGEYRMRFQYFHSHESCLLMGQEILEYARL